MDHVKLHSGHRIRNVDLEGPSSSPLPFGQGGSQHYCILVLRLEGEKHWMSRLLSFTELPGYRYTRFSCCILCLDLGDNQFLCSFAPKSAG